MIPASTGGAGTIFERHVGAMRRNRRQLLPTLLLALGTPPGGSIDRAEEWQDPLVIGRNKQPAHATLVPYATVEQALA